MKSKLPLANPESGTTSYTYNGDGTMATGERRKLRKSGPLLAS